MLYILLIIMFSACVGACGCSYVGNPRTTNSTGFYLLAPSFAVFNGNKFKFEEMPNSVIENQIKRIIIQLLSWCIMDALKPLEPVRLFLCIKNMSLYDVAYFSNYCNITKKDTNDSNFEKITSI